MLQNFAARVETKSSYDYFSGSMKKSLNKPTLAEMILMGTACMGYKSLNRLFSYCLEECKENLNMKYEKLRL